MLWNSPYLRSFFMSFPFLLGNSSLFFFSCVICTICEGVWENQSHVGNFEYGLFCIFGCRRASWTFCFLNFENISIWGWVMAIYVSEIPVMLKWRKLHLEFVFQILLSFCIQRSKSCSISKWICKNNIRGSLLVHCPALWSHWTTRCTTHWPYHLTNAAGFFYHQVNPSAWE